VLPGGPAARSGLIEGGMWLVSVDGQRLDAPSSKDPRTVLGERIGEYRQSADGRFSTRLQSFRTLRWAQLAKSVFTGVNSRQLADAGLWLADDGQVKCQASGAVLPGVSKDESLTDAIRKHMPQSCPLTNPAHLRAIEEMPDVPHIAPRDEHAPPHHLSCGIILGFLPPRAGQAVITVTENGLDAADWQRVVYVWLRPEPVAPLLPPGKRGRVLVDIDRVVLRLRYFDVEGSRYRDTWGGALLDTPTSAYTWRDLEEVLDAQGRLIFVNHHSKTTALEPPALVRASARASARARVCVRLCTRAVCLCAHAFLVRKREKREFIRNVTLMGFRV